MIPSTKSRVLITGIGAVSGWGWGVDKLWRGLCSGQTAIKDFHRFSHDEYLTHIASEVPETKPVKENPGKIPGWERLSHADRFAIASSAEAINMAGLPKVLAENDAGVFFSSSTGGMFEGEEFYFPFKSGGMKDSRIGLLASHLVSCPAQSVARCFRVTGPVQTESSACASGSLAVGLAFEALQRNEVKVAIAGGADSLCRITYGGFNSLRVVDEKPSAPFRRNRTGLSIGEGGAAMILETLSNAQTRGATPIAEILGVGSSNDAYHMTAPHPEGEGATLALRMALENAGLEPDSIDFMNTHGTGTSHNDLAEWKAMLNIFGERAFHLPVTSTKASIGHLLGSAGAIEAVATVLCLWNGMVHPTPGVGEIDPETPVNLVQNRPKSIPQIRNGVSLNLAFGGCNAALIFSRWNGA